MYIQGWWDDWRDSWWDVAEVFVFGFISACYGVVVAVVVVVVADSLSAFPLYSSCSKYSKSLDSSIYSNSFDWVPLSHHH